MFDLRKTGYRNRLTGPTASMTVPVKSGSPFDPAVSRMTTTTATEEEEFQGKTKLMFSGHKFGCGDNKFFIL